MNLRDLLKMPIVCSKKVKSIRLEDGCIISGQRYANSVDPDMSDVAIGFYEIVYADVLQGKHILGEDRLLADAEFAGDTMNSFNTVANTFPEAGPYKAVRTPENEWPEILRVYGHSYSCLANYWMLPCGVGRDIKGPLNKARRPVADYMDRFLEMVREEVDFGNPDRPYFGRFESWDDFVDKHFLRESYIGPNGKVLPMSCDGGERFIDAAMQAMDARAKAIAESKYAPALQEWLEGLGRWG